MQSSLLSLGLRALVLAAAITLVVADDPVYPPKPTIKVLQPKGFSVSIPDHSGMKLFAFHGSFNQELPDRKAGQINVDVTSKSGGHWTYVNKDRKVQDGDTLHYWLWAEVDGLGQERLNKQHTFRLR